jgi:ABC-type transport system substrate-binding protein
MGGLNNLRLDGLLLQMGTLVVAVTGCPTTTTTTEAPTTTEPPSTTEPHTTTVATTTAEATTTTEVATITETPTNTEVANSGVPDNCVARTYTLANGGLSNSLINSYDCNNEAPNVGCLGLFTWTLLYNPGVGCGAFCYSPVCLSANAVTFFF